MSEKRKDARAQKKNEDVVALIAGTEKYFEQIEERLSAAEDTTDAAEKILKLRDLRDEIQKAVRQAVHKQSGIVEKRVSKKKGITAGVGAPVAVAAAVVPMAVLFPPSIPPLVILGLMSAITGGVYPATLLGGHFTKTSRKKLIEQNPILTYFGNILTAQKTRVQEVLDDTIKNCNLDEVSLSPHYKEAFDSTASLRDRFAEAATTSAKQALEAKAQQESAEASKIQKESGSPKRLKITRLGE